MKRNEAVETLKDFLKEYIAKVAQKSKSGLYNCPICGSGTGKNRTGAFSITQDGKRWKCFACGEGGDIFELIGKVESLSDFNRQLERAADIFGIIIDEEGGRGRMSAYQNKAEQPPAQEAEQDFTQFFEEASKRLNETNYHRGISLETLNRYKIGFCPEWKHPKAKKIVPASPRLIIPTGKSSYLARYAGSAPESQKQYEKQKVGKVQIFNLRALREARKPVYIVEGELDALSIIDVGGEAVALGSIGKADSLLRVLKESAPAQPLIIALDNDAAGKKAAETLAGGLEKIGVEYFAPDANELYGNLKDANAALNQNREAFAERVAAAENFKAEAEAAKEEAEKAKKEAYKKNSNASYMHSFLDGIDESADTQYIPTGFKILDKLLEGGVHEGLYVIGAISSLGKTAFVMQAADQIAQGGNDVLVFSLEMARSELMARSMSRHTLQRAISYGKEHVRDAKTAPGITTGSRWKNYSDREQALIFDAMEDYNQYCANIYVHEGIGDIGAAKIREAVGQHIEYTGKRPVVIVDYLQILAPWNERATDKQNIDKSVLELKRISRDYKIPVIGISSFNRANYSTRVGMEAFKESGAIEYSSDVLIGLQLQGVGSEDFNVEAAKASYPRKIELAILKNRSGAAGKRVLFNYYPKFNFFDEVEEAERG